MSSLGDVLVKPLGEAVERGAQKLTSKLEESSVGRGVLNMAGNQEWELDLTPGGRAIKTMQNQYNLLHDQALKQETDKIAALRQWHQNDDVARNSLPIKTATMADYHTHAVATGHPIRTVTHSILASDVDKAGVSRNLGLTQQEMMVKNESLARLKALTGPGSYGSNFENAAPIIAEMRLSEDPRMVNHAQRVADIISNQVRDTKVIKNIDTSYSKYSMNKAFKASNKVLASIEEPQIPYLRENPTYEKPTEAERTAHRVLDTMMLPFLSLKHVGQFFNLPASSPLPAMGASLLRMSRDEMEKTVEASSIVASTLWRATYRDILGETGKVAEWTHSPTMGKILARTIHQPGFTWFRRQQLNIAGSVGFHSAIYWAHNFAESGSKIAEARLKEMEIDPLDVLKQKGKLNEEQLQKGIYHYTNNRMFFNKGVDNSLWQNKNVFARAGFMYHSFVNSQASFMRRELLIMAKSGDIKGLAQFAGTMAVLFPNVAPLLGGAEKLLTTGSPQQAKETVKQGYGHLYSAKSVPEWLGNYINLMSHIGAAGTYFNYLNAIKGHRIEAALAGPFVGAIGTDLVDIYGAASKEGKGKSAYPLGRDVLKQTVPVVGSPLAHHIFPTQIDESGEGSAQPKRTNRFRVRGIKRR